MFLFLKQFTNFFLVTAPMTSFIKLRIQFLPRRYTFFIFSSILAFSHFSLYADIIPVPELHARVTDLTDTLSADDRAALEEKLTSFETEKGSQIVVLIVPTTGDETIEQFSIRTAEEWKIGRKGIDDGIILLAAKEDRKLRIEVGYGLEGVMTDVLSKRIIDDIIVPHFKSGEFYEGIDAGTTAILTVVSGEELPLPELTPDGEYSDSEDSTNAYSIIFVLFTFIGFIMRLIFGALIGFFSTGIITFLIGIIFLPFLEAAGLAIVVAFVASFMGSGGSGGYSSSGSGGFSSGGGGFSGGGGSFGGGGASGSW